MVRSILRNGLFSALVFRHFVHFAEWSQHFAKWTKPFCEVFVSSVLEFKIFTISQNGVTILRNGPDRLFFSVLVTITRGMVEFGPFREMVQPFRELVPSAFWS